MTLYGLLASLAWAAVAVYAVRHVVEYRRSMWHLKTTTKLDVVRIQCASAERIALPVKKDPIGGLPAKDDVPDDLVAVANQESEEWARDDAIQDIRVKYSVLGDWQKVRRAIGIGEIP